MASTYGWVISGIGAAILKEMPELADEIGTMGPRNISDAMAKTLQTNSRAGVSFRMYDDDENLIYTGRFMGDKDSVAAFGPLDDYGEPNFGCTEIHYRNASGKYERL